MNRITVVGDDTINAQARTHAEYRVFAALARHTRSVGRVRVVLRHTDERGTCDKVTCVVRVNLEPAGSLRIRVRGPHVYAAINRAVERLRHCPVPCIFPCYVRCEVVDPPPLASETGAKRPS